MTLPGHGEICKKYAFLANSQAQNSRTKQNSFLEAIIKRSNLSTAYGSYLLANARLESYPIVHARNLVLEKFEKKKSFFFLIETSAT